MRLHEVVEGVVEDYLGCADAEAGGLIEGLYLEGSVALGDFRPRTSDIDFLAVTVEPLDGAALAALERVHARLRDRWPRPHFDGAYVTWEDLGRAPAELGARPGSQEGRFLRAGSPRSERPNGSGALNPVTWHTVARYGVACRGPRPEELEMWADAAAMAAWCDENLERYWRRLLCEAARWSSGWGLATLTAYGTLWIVSGVCRIHYTLATGDITSKERACQYGLEAFPGRWGRVLKESLRIRRADRARPTWSSALIGLGEHGWAGAGWKPAVQGGRLRIRQAGPRRSLYGSPLARRRDVLEFAELVIRAGHRQAGWDGQGVADWGPIRSRGDHGGGRRYFRRSYGADLSRGLWPRGEVPGHGQLGWDGPSVAAGVRLGRRLTFGTGGSHVVRAYGPGE